VIGEDKAGYLNTPEFPLLQQLGFNKKDWLQLAQHFGKEYHQAVGSIESLCAFAAHTGKHWVSGHRQQANIFH